MSAALLNPGDELDATVVSVKPFGIFVTTESGVNGLVRGADATVGETVRIRIDEFDAVEHRFRASTV
jgi:ribosomal protein S1